jgi:hypothetical protein
MSRNLNPDPRLDPKLFIYTPTAWVVFDTAGRIIEQSSSAKADGTVVSVSRTSYDPKGRVESSSDGRNEWRTEAQVAGQGTVEVKTFGISAHGADCACSQGISTGSCL